MTRKQIEFNAPLGTSQGVDRKEKRTVTASGTQVFSHAVGVRENGGGGTNLSSHVADRSHAYQRTKARTPSNYPCQMSHNQGESKQIYGA